MALFQRRSGAVAEWCKALACNVNMNAIVETNSDEVNAAANDMDAAGAATSSSTPQQPQTATLDNSTPPTMRPSQRTQVGADRDDPGVSTDPAFNRTEDDASGP